MAKIPDDLMKRLAGKTNTERTQKEHVENTKRTRERDFKKYKDSKFDTLTIRLLPEDIQQLRFYFERRGITVSQGIRMIIKEYMEREGI